MLRRRNRLHMRLEIVGEAQQRLLLDILPVVLEPIGELRNIGRREGARIITAADERFGQISADGSLAIRAGDMNELEPAVGMAQPLHEQLHPLQARPDAVVDQPLDPAAGLLIAPQQLRWLLARPFLILHMLRFLHV